MPRATVLKSSIKFTCPPIGLGEATRSKYLTIASATYRAEPKRPALKQATGPTLTPAHLKGIIIILIISLASTLVYINYSRQDSTKVVLKTIETGPTLAIVIQGNEAKYNDNGTFIGVTALIRLLTDDSANGLKKGDIADYMILTDDPNTNNGYLLQGTTFNNQGPVFQVSISTQFFKEFVNSGDHIVMSAELMGSDGILFGVNNLGEYDVTSLRASINGTVLPFTFGVSRDSPVKPSWSYSGEASTTWYDPAEKVVKGVHLEMNHSYAVHLEVGLSDGSRKVVDEVVPYRPWFGIASIVAMSAVDHLTIDLLEVNGSLGTSVVSVSFRNTWGCSGPDSWVPKNITKIELFVDDLPVSPATCNLRVSDSWVGSTRTPEAAYQGGVYKVTILLTASDGSTFTTSQDVTCQPL